MPREEHEILVRMGEVPAGTENPYAVAYRRDVAFLLSRLDRARSDLGTQDAVRDLQVQLTDARRELRVAKRDLARERLRLGEAEHKADSLKQRLRALAMACPTCGGDGGDESDADGRLVVERCATCGGSGQIPYDGEPGRRLPEQRSAYTIDPEF